MFTELSCDCPIQQQASDDCVFHQLDQTQHQLCYHTLDWTHNPSTHQQSHHHWLMTSHGKLLYTLRCECCYYGCNLRDYYHTTTVTSIAMTTTTTTCSNTNTNPMFYDFQFLLSKPTPFVLLQTPNFTEQYLWWFKFWYCLDSNSCIKEKTRSRTQRQIMGTSWKDS